MISAISFSLFTLCKRG